MRYSEDPDLRADGDPTSDIQRERCPKVGEKAKAMLAKAETLPEALFDLTEVFRVPVTNNIPWFEDHDTPSFEGGDPDRPVYHVAEFIEQVTACFARAGWAPPGGAIPVEALREALDVATGWAEHGYSETSKAYWAGMRDTLRVLLGITTQAPSDCTEDAAADILFREAAIVRRNGS